MPPCIHRILQCCYYPRLPKHPKPRQLKERPLSKPTYPLELMALQALTVSHLLSWMGGSLPPKLRVLCELSSKHPKWWWSRRLPNRRHSQHPSFDDSRIWIDGSHFSTICVLPQVHMQRVNWPGRAIVWPWSRSQMTSPKFLGFWIPLVAFWANLQY